MIEIATIREELRLTQTELADLLGVSPRTVQSCEQGWREPSAALEKTLLLHLIISRRGAALCSTSCWDHMECPVQSRQECPAYRSRQGHLCWMLTGNLCCSQGERVADWAEKKTICRDCSFFAVLTKARDSASDTRP